MYCVGLPATIRFWTAFLIAMLCGLADEGCSSPPSRLLQNGVGRIPVKPYEDTFFVAHSPELVARALYDVLNETGAMVIAADRSHGLISWCDRSGLFHPLVQDRTQQAVQYVSPDVRSPNLLQFHGVVYACARLKARENGTILKLHAKQRDEQPWVLELSNGDYERYIHRCLKAHLQRIANSPVQSDHDSTRWRTHELAQTSPEVTTKEENPEDRGGRPRTASYGSLYFRHFSSLRIPTAQEIQSVGQHEVYPAPIRVFWEACLDILCQYDAVAALDSTQRIAVVSHGMSLPSPQDSGAAARYCNAVIAVLAQARGDTGTDVYIAWLPPGTLVPSAIEPLECSTAEQLERLARAQPHRVTAARVVSQLREHVSTQLYWRDWLSKLSARRSSKASGTR